MAHRIARIANGNWNLALEELDAGNENRQHLDMFNRVAVYYSTRR